MATIKSYSDISQSKKLAEFLPLESADMHYFNYGNIAKPYIGFDVNETKPEINKEVYEYIPCWSLVALLGVLPDYTLQTNTDGTVFVVCDSKKPMISDAYDNPIDACYEMIIRLNELKMLDYGSKRFN